MAISQYNAIQSIRARLDEPNSRYWSDDDLRRWINEIAKDMARRTECLRGTYSQAVTVGTSSYTPAFTATTNVYRVHRVEYLPSGNSQIYPLEYRDPNAADEIWGLSQAITEGIPVIWTSWGAPPNLTIQIFPSPSIAGTLKLWYYRLPTELAVTNQSDAADNVDIVDGWEDVLVDGVEYKAMRRDSNPLWTEAKQEYEQHLQAMMEATTRFTEAAGVITTPSGIGIPAWLYGGADW